MFRSSSAIVMIAALAILGGCDKSFSPGTSKETAAKDGAAPQELAQADQPEADPNNPDRKEVLKNLSQDLLDKLKTTDNDEEAASIEEEVYDAWLVSGSATVDTLMKRGLDYQAHNELDAAREAFDYAIAIKPDYAEVWNRRAGLFFAAGEYDEALRDLESAITYEPRHFGAWIELGMIFESINRPEAALKAYRKALEIHPHAAAAKAGEKRCAQLTEGRPL